MEAQHQFAGLWIRAWAKTVDVIILIPVILLLNWFARTSQLAAAVAIPAQGLLIYFYNLCFLAQSGQTPGKRMAGIKVIALDGSPPGWKRSFLRNLDTLVETVPWDTALVIAAFSVSPAAYNGLSRRAHGKLLTAARPEWAHYLEHAILLWLALEIGLVLFTSNKRAAHDFIGGTVVIRTSQCSRP